jgi:cyclic 2,3-diphosphoglycerate synthase
VVVVAMGRGGPEHPELVAAGERPIGVDDLLERARLGMHAASDFLEDAVFAEVTTIGARRCGGGLSGGTYLSNVIEAAHMAEQLDPDLVLLEGSGAAVPPVRADRTVLVTAATRSALTLTSGLGPVRVLSADLVVITMCERGWSETRAAVEAIAPDVTVVPTVLRPQPAEPLGDDPVVYFTTASPESAGALADGLECELAAVVTSLSDRTALRQALDRPRVRGAQTYLVEIKAAAVDVVCEVAAERGVRVVFCDNVPVSLPGEPDLDDELMRMAGEAVGAHA